MCDVMLDEWSWWRDLMRSDRRGGQNSYSECSCVMWCWMSEGGEEIWWEVSKRWTEQWWCWMNDEWRTIMRSVHVCWWRDLMRSDRRGGQNSGEECWCVMWCWMSEVGGEIWCEVIEEVDRSMLRSVHVWCDVGWVKVVERFDAKWSKRWTEQSWGVLMCDVMLDEWSWWRDLMRSDRRGGQRDLMRSDRRGGQNSYRECSCMMWCWMSEGGGEIWCEVIEEVDRTVVGSVDVWCDVGWVKLVERFDAKWSKRWTEQSWGVLMCDVMLDEWSWWRDLMRSDRRGGQNSHRECSCMMWCGWVKLVERFDAKWSKRWTEQSWGVLMCDVMLDEWSWWRDLMRSDRRGGQNSHRECSCVMWCWMSEGCWETGPFSWSFFMNRYLSVTVMPKNETSVTVGVDIFFV